MLQPSLFPERRRRKPPPALERRTHIAIADLLRKAGKPDLVWTHIASGEFRTDATAALLKRLGVAPGWPDFIFIDADGGVAFMELKRATGRLSPAQLGFRDVCVKRGIRHAVCKSFDEAVAQLQNWEFLRSLRISA